MVIAFQCRALESLGKKRSPEGLSLLCETAAMPAKKATKISDVDMMLQGSLGQDQFDLRLAALRGLENYKNDPTAAQVLYRIMTTENDVALKDRAYLSLMKVTGKDFAPKSPDWAAIVKINPPTPGPSPVATRPQPVVLPRQQVGQPAPALTNLQPVMPSPQPAFQPTPAPVLTNLQPVMQSPQPAFQPTPAPVLTNLQPVMQSPQPGLQPAPAGNMTNQTSVNWSSANTTSQPPAPPMLPPPPVAGPVMNPQPVSPYNQQLILPDR